MATDTEREALIEAVAGAWRSHDAYGTIQSHSAWHDLDDAGRQEAYRAALVERTLESALDPRGLSATGRAILRYIARK
jgi:hypothetical protein